MKNWIEDIGAFIGLIGFCAVLLFFYIAIQGAKKMQTKTIITYSFDELDQEIQEKIAETWRANDCFFWSDEWIDSLKGFAEYFGINLKDWSVDSYGPSYVNFDFKWDDQQRYKDSDDSLARSEISGFRLYKMLLNRYSADSMESCCFTGYCGDEALMKPIREFIKKPSKYFDFNYLIDCCFDEWIKAFKKDIEHWESFDCIKEEILLNEYQFTESGNLA